MKLVTVVRKIRVLPQGLYTSLICISSHFGGIITAIIGKQSKENARTETALETVMPRVAYSPAVWHNPSFTCNLEWS